MLKFLTGHAMLIDVTLPSSLSRYITVLRIFLFTAYSMFPNGSKSFSSSMYPKKKKKNTFIFYFIHPLIKSSTLIVQYTSLDLDTCQSQMLISPNFTLFPLRVSERSSHGVQSERLCHQTQSQSLSLSLPPYD